VAHIAQPLAERTETGRGTLAATLAQHRQERRMSQTAVVEALRRDYAIQLTQRGYSKIERGASDPSARTAAALGRLFGIDLYAVLLPDR
jgi:transcriptional regulator with XRE-family HTH domain